MKPLLLVPFLSALLLLHALTGGTRLYYSIPAYALLCLAAILSIFAKPAPAAARPALSCVVATGLLVAWIAGRAIASPVEYLWWTDFFMVLACAVAYALVAFHFTAASDRQLILGAFMVVAAGEVVLALYQFSRANEFMLFGILRAPAGRRASGFYISPNHLAGFLESIGLIALSCACWSRWRPAVRILAGYVAVSCFIGVAVTGSRGGYLATTAGLVAFGLISVAIVAAFDRSRAFILGVAGAVVLFGAVGTGYYVMRENPYLRDRLDTLEQQFGGSGRLDVRIYNWQATLDQFHVSPWTGTGAGTHIFYGRYFRRPPIQSDPVHAHSDYLELIADYGVVGGIAMALFLAAHVGIGVRRLSCVVRREMLPRGEMSHDRAGLLVGCFSAVGAMAVHSVVDFNLHIPANALLFAVIFAILAGGGEPDPRAKETRGFHWSRIAVPALGVWLALTAVPKFPSFYWFNRGLLEFEKVRLTAALPHFRKAVELEPRNAAAYFYLGETNRGLGTAIRHRALRPPFFQEAVKAFQAALQLFPQDEETWVRLGQAYDGLKDFRNAEIAYLTAIALDRNLGILYAHYAAHLRLRGRFEDADAQIKKAQEFMIRDSRPILERSLDAPNFEVK